jgi:hypothetical protein
VKRFVFSAAAGVLFASVALADNQPATGSPTPGGTSAAPVVTATMPSVGTYSYSGTSTRRMGLFSRLRNRSGSSTMMAAPMMPATTVTMPSTVTAPSTGASVPSPMPSTSAAPAVTGQPVVVGGTTVMPDGTMVMPAGGRMTRNGRVIPASGVITSNGMVQTVQGMQAPCANCDGQMVTTTMTTSSQRMGLIARLRARR